MNEKLKIGLNGFGIMGRLIYRAIHDDGSATVEIINDVTSKENLEYLLRNDTVHGRRKDLSLAAVTCHEERNPSKLDWHGIAVVVDSTPYLKTRELLGMHIANGARYVIRTSPIKGSLAMVQVLVPGVNLHEFDPQKYHVYSMASCTTNCLAQLVKGLQDHCNHTGNSIEYLDFVTVHAKTSDQGIKDSYHNSDPVRGRDDYNILHTSTGASSQIGLLFPRLEGKIFGTAYRVPVSDGSILELRVTTKNPIALEKVMQCFRKIAENRDPDAFSYETEPLVSSDAINDPHTCIFLERFAQQITPNKLKLVALYDNEFGYACQIVQLIKKIPPKCP